MIESGLHSTPMVCMIARLSLAVLLVEATVTESTWPTLPTNPPVLPTKGAVETGVYRNMFVELGLDEKVVSDRVDAIFEQLFLGNKDEEAVFYEAADGSGAYILDVGDNDVRSEGMSYGMMAAVQRNNATAFSLLWKWAKTHMRHNGLDDPRHGYFAWHCKTSGDVLDNNPASDGETWFASALYSAAARWGRDDYREEADALLDDTTNKTGKVESVTSMFINSTGVTGVDYSVVFVPYANSATFTDPSYHLPAFYEMWRRHARTAEKAAFWGAFQASSRNFLHMAAAPTSGLSPDYATFAGKPTGGQRNFAFDAWRVAQNRAMDYAWFASDARAVAYCNTLHRFFAAANTSKPYGNQFDVSSGRQLSGDHSPGLVAMNAVCSLASNSTLAWSFVAELWQTPTPRGKWRYYDGMLYLLGWLQLSGNFKYYTPGRNAKVFV